MKVVDINNNLKSTCNGVFWVDTNVLLWYFYYPTINISASAKYQLLIYPPFISNLISSNCLVATSIYNISEMIPCIERTEFEAYCKKSGLEDDLKDKGKFKDFRNMVENRIMIKAKIENVLMQIKNLVAIETGECSFDLVLSYIDDYLSHQLDFFDFLLAKNVECNKNTNLVTDDKDFVNRNLDFVTYTANRKFISNAKHQGIVVC